jgi:hypothetical protein
LNASDATLLDFGVARGLPGIAGAANYPGGIVNHSRISPMWDGQYRDYCQRCRKRECQEVVSEQIWFTFIPDARYPRTSPLMKLLQLFQVDSIGYERPEAELEHPRHPER